MNLYTKYRSQQFKDVVGQEQIVRILTNAIKLDRVGHAYLFSGPRGTGKTTLARLLAKSLNCVNRKKGEVEPCGDCSSCREINLGTSMDIIEIDAASNRGIDEMRALRDNVRFAASGMRYKIFIIDEVHMMTREAFNALLKTLEEPPHHVIFIMATTELFKVPETIISRTLSFDFQLHKTADIIKQITKIAKKEKIVIDEQSIRLIAQNAKGGMRDAITLLDQVSATSGDIDEKTTRSILGLSSFESLALVMKCIFAKDTQKALKILEKLYKDGVDFYQFNLELLEIAQKMMLYNAGLENALDEYTKEEKATIVKIVQNACPEQSRGVQIVTIVEKLLNSANETKNTQMTELPLELAIVELTKRGEMGSGQWEVGKEVRSGTWDMSQDVGNEKDKLKTKNQKPKINIQKEKKEKEKEMSLEKLELSQEVRNGSKEKTEKKNLTSHNPYPTSTVKIGFETVQKKWPEFMKAFEKANGLKTFLENSAPVEIAGDRLVVAVQFGFYKDKLESTKNYQRVSEIFEKVYKTPIVFKFQVDEKLVKKVQGMDSSESSEDPFAGDSPLTNDAEDIFK